MTKDESGALEAMEEKIKKNKPDAEKIKEEIDAQHQGYWDIVLHKVPENQWMQTSFLYRYDFFDEVLWTDGLFGLFHRTYSQLLGGEYLDWR
ncbi:MAG: hypothetical protein IPK46_09380 [Saprospiraceae bacterium]|nr:hypothetical protein [Saprospiraceae bacterium]